MGGLLSVPEVKDQINPLDEFQLSAKGGEIMTGSLTTKRPSLRIIKKKEYLYS